MNKNNNGYFDGHYIDSGLTIEEREKIEKKALENDEKLDEWPTT